MSKPVLLIASEAMNHPSDQRTAFIKEQCADDQQRIQEVHVLIDAAFAATAAGQRQSTTPAPLLKIPGYSLKELIGQGGMGAVYRALQQSTQREVAIKIIRPELAAPELRRRFRTEATLLAKLDNRGIAKIIDAGETADALAFLSMELIDGQRIDQYVDQKQLSSKQTVGLLMQVAQAVQHAHLRGVLHRDIKPANILVTDQGQPKVLDFGVARTLDADPRQATMLTNTGELIGTIAYMAPEQIKGQPDVRSDVYGLGVTLFELLSQRKPFEFTQSGLLEAVRTITETRPISLSKAAPDLPRDLHAIVDKAIDPDPEYRYQSALQLADDLNRFLSHKPVEAVPLTKTRALKLFIKRHALVSSAALIVATSLITATVVSMTFAIKAKQAQNQAVARNESLNAMNQFLSTMLSAANPENAMGEQLTVRELVDESVRSLETLKDQPVLASELHNVLSATYLGLGELELAEQQADIALQQLAKLHPKQIQIESKSTLQKAMILNEMARQHEAEPLLRQNLDQAHLSEELRLQTIATLGTTLIGQGKHKEAQSLLSQALQNPRSDLDPSFYETIEHNLAEAVTLLGDLDQAKAMLETLVEKRTQRLGPRHPFTLSSRNNLANLIVKTGDFENARQIYSVLLNDRSKIQGERHPATMVTKNNLVGMLIRLGQLEQAEPLARDVVSFTRDRFGEAAERSLVAMNILAFLLEDQGKIEAAETQYRQILDIIGDRDQALTPELLGVRNNLAMLLMSQDKLQASDKQFRLVMSESENVVGKEHIYYALYENNFGALLTQSGQLEEAQTRLTHSSQIIQSILGDTHPRTLRAQERHKELGKKQRELL